MTAAVGLGSRRPIALALAALLVTSCATRHGTDARDTEPSIVVDGVSRTYRIHVPSPWDGKRPVPLLFVFHGAGSNADDIERGSGFDALVDATPMLVIYPEGTDQHFDVDPPAGRVSTDVRFVDALLAQLRSRFPVDERRVFASGFSNGAAFCYRLAAERPDVIAAIAPVAGYLPSLAPAAAIRPIPLMHVHGTADRRVMVPPLVGGEGSPISAWARRNGASHGPVTSTLPATGELVVRRAAYAGSTPRADAVLLLVEGADHEWPGGPGGPITRAILDFFRVHPRD